MTSYEIDREEKLYNLTNVAIKGIIVNLNRSDYLELITNKQFIKDKVEEKLFTDVQATIRGDFNIITEKDYCYISLEELTGENIKLATIYEKAKADYLTNYFKNLFMKYLNKEMKVRTNFVQVRPRIYPKEKDQSKIEGRLALEKK